MDGTIFRHNKNKDNGDSRTVVTFKDKEIKVYNSIDDLSEKQKEELDQMSMKWLNFDSEEKELYTIPRIEAERKLRMTSKRIQKLIDSRLLIGYNPSGYRWFIFDESVEWFSKLNDNIELFEVKE